MALRLSPVLLWILSSLILIIPDRVISQANLPTIQVQPTTIELPTSAPIEVTIVLHNPTQQLLQDLKLTWSAPPGVSVELGTANESKALLTNGDAMWIVRVDDEPNTLPQNGQILFRATYTPVRGGTNETVAMQVALGTLTITARPRPAITTVAQVETISSGETISQERTGYIHLNVRNSYDVPIQVTSVQYTAVPFINVVSQHSLPLQLEPGSTVVLPFALRGTDTVQPGNYTVVFSVQLQWERLGVTEQASLVATREISVGVLGEQDLLALLALPSFLVLPGFLAVLVFRMMWQASLKPDKRESIPLKLREPEFWVFALTVSGVMLFAYPYVSPLLGLGRRDYRDGYSFGDIAAVWLISVGFGFLAFVLVAAIRRLVQAAQQSWHHRLAEELPSVEDEPYSLLKRKALQRLALGRPLVERIVDGRKEQVLVLGPREGERIWVSPPIVVRWTPGVETAEQVALTSKFELDKPIGDLIPFLEQKVASGQLSLHYRINDSLSHPNLVEPNAYTPVKVPSVLRLLDVDEGEDEL